MIKKNGFLILTMSSFLSCTQNDWEEIPAENESINNNNIKSVSASLTRESRSDRRINEIAFPATHNSYNYSPRFEKSNVFEEMPTQFEKGIRAVEIDIHRKPKYGLFGSISGYDTSVFHGQDSKGINGCRLAHYVLAEITEFLEDNPNEIVFLKFETTAPSNRLDQEIEEADLDDHIYNYDPVNNPYPTKQEIIESGRRCVITRHIDGSDYGTSLDRHTFGGGHTSRSDATPQSSPSNKKYFSVEHYGITSTFGYGDSDDAKYFQDPSRLGTFVDEVWKLNGKKPWRVIVDFPCVKNNNYYSVMEDLENQTMLKFEIRRDNGEIFKDWDDGSVKTITWNCQFGNQNVTAKSSGEGSFPMKNGETVTLTPTCAGYSFEPASITITNENTQDYKQVFRVTWNS